MPKVKVQLEDWAYSAPMSALLLWLSLTAFFDSKLRLAVMASKIDCCRELSRGRQASEAYSVFFSLNFELSLNFSAQRASAAGGLGLLSSYERLTVVA